MSLTELRRRRAKAMSASQLPRRIQLSNTSPLRYDFSVAVWGEAFCDTFLNVVLPHQLTYGNLGAFDPALTAYRIYSDESDIELMNSHPAFMQLRSMFPSTLTYAIDSIYKGQRYDALNECAKHTLNICYETGAVAVFPIADTVWGDGSFRYAKTVIESGKRVVLASCPRLNKQAFCSLAKQWHRPRELVAVGLQCLHPITKALVVGADTSHPTVSCVYWRSEKWLVARYIYPLPLMVRPSDSSILPSATIDCDLAINACPNTDLWHFVSDSDDAIGFELTDGQHGLCDINPHPTNFEEHVAYRHANKQHRATWHCFSHPAVFHTGEKPDRDPSAEFYRRVSERI